MTRFIENEIAEEAMKTSGTLIHETAIRVRQSMPQKVSGSSFSDQCDEINSIVEQALNPAGTQVLSEGKDLDKRYVGKQEPVKVTAKPEKPEAVKHVAVGKKPEQMKGKPEQNKTVKKKYVGESKKTLAEAFMKPEIYEGDAYSVETNQGTFVVPADLASIEMGIGQVLTDDDATFQSAKEALEDFVEGEIQEISMDHGWLGRYQAPGYMDATEWGLYDSKEEAEAELQSMYGDDEEEMEESLDQKKYRISNENSGTDLGVYSGKNEFDAYKNMMKDAGYSKGTDENGDPINQIPKNIKVSEVENESEEGCESEEDEPKEESTLQKMITRLSEKAEKLGESKNKEHRKLAFFISERILPVAMVKSENEGGDKDILKDLSQALRMLASKLADQDEKKDLESMAQTMDAEIVPAAPVSAPVEESKKKSEKPLKEDEDSDEESSDNEDDESESQDEPQDEDIVMQPMGNLGGKTLVSVVGGKKIGAFVELEDAEKAIREYMKKNNVSPTVWQISDHGNASVYEMDKEMAEEGVDPVKEAKEARWLANELDEKFQTMVHQVAGKMHYDINSAMNFCVALLEDVNAHPEAKAVNDALLSFEESKNMGEAKKNDKVKKYDKVWVLRLINSRHYGDVEAAKEALKELKKALGDDFRKELLKHGDPDEPGKFDQVLAAWQKEVFSESKNMGEDKAPSQMTGKLSGDLAKGEKFMSDEEISAEYDFFLDPENKVSIKWRPSKDSGWIDVNMPKAEKYNHDLVKKNPDYNDDDLADEDFHTGFIIYDDGKIAFDDWMPEKAYHHMVSLIKAEKSKIKESKNLGEAEEKKSYGKFAKNKIKPGEQVWHKGRKATVHEYHGGNGVKIRIQGWQPEMVDVSELEAVYPDQAE